ncbi:MAG: phosphatase PAP2 family protein [Comamonadaceae bacterium]|nr:MAG: phosphatase PAP2 family protein [Comamonadaceae bacterium]
MDPSSPSILAAREFAAQYERWGKDTAFLDGNWIETEDLDWRFGAKGFAHIESEIAQLQQLMQDDRDRYMAEIEAQADGLPGYVIAFIGASQERHPWTIELIQCGLAMGNVAYMRWKSLYRRVRPSFLCPALAPPFGPPGHPAFPSGHATLGHLIALLLLEIPALCARYGLFKANAQGAPAVRGGPVSRTDLQKTQPINSPLLWLAARLAKNRERLGVHYPSDSAAGRHLAANMWHALLHEKDVNKKITCPTLLSVLARAKAEWPQ